MLLCAGICSPDFYLFQRWVAKVLKSNHSNCLQSERYSRFKITPWPGWVILQQLSPISMVEERKNSEEKKKKSCPFFTLHKNEKQKWSCSWHNHALKSFTSIYFLIWAHREDVLSLLNMTSPWQCRACCLPVTIQEPNKCLFTKLMVGNGYNLF